MARTKITARRKDRANFGPKIFVPRPQGGPNIRKLRAGDNPQKRRLTDAIAKRKQIEIVNRTRNKRTEKPKFKIKKLLPKLKTVQIKKMDKS